MIWVVNHGIRDSIGISGLILTSLATSLATVSASLTKSYNFATVLVPKAVFRYLANSVKPTRGNLTVVCQTRSLRMSLIIIIVDFTFTVFSEIWLIL
jgi:hypothetical protein